jgi:hypothetical protein
MANTKWFEGCGDATQDLTFWTNQVGTVTADTTQFVQSNNGSGCSLKCDRTAANAASNIRTPTGVLADAGRAITVWWKPSALSSANDTIMRIVNSGGSAILTVQFNTTGKIAVGGNSGTAVIVPGIWYRLTLSYTITSTTVNTFKLYINGTLDNTQTNLTLPGVGSDGLLLAAGTGATMGINLVCWFDHLYIDDRSDFSDPGDIRVTAKLPASNNVNNYNTAIGNNPANRWQNVNERPLSITNGWEDTTGTSQVVENYGIQAKTAGDVDITPFVQISYMGWMWAKEGSVSGTPQLTVNGVDNAVTLTTSAALYRAITDSATYPNNAAGIGMKSGNTATGSFLYECGIQIAFLWTQTYPPYMVALTTPGNADASASYTVAL